MHTALQAARAKLFKRIGEKVAQVGLTPKDQKHVELITGRMFSHYATGNRRFEFLLRYCPACRCGYFYDLVSDADSSLPVITKTDLQIKPYSSYCPEREE